MSYDETQHSNNTIIISADAELRENCRVLQQSWGDPIKQKIRCYIIARVFQVKQSMKIPLRETCRNFLITER